jgi:ABC-type glycerol-3-phosphate transport system substrate-binding protein
MLSNRRVMLLIVILIVGILSSCSKAINQGEEVKKDNVVKSNEHVELVFYSVGEINDKDFNEKYGDQLQKKFPNYTIKFIPNKKGTSMTELMAAGTPIDIYYESIGQFINGLIQYNLQYDMTDLIKKHNVDLNRFEPTMIDAMKVISKGGMYGLPVTNLDLALYYNKDIFDKFGVPYLKDGMNWDVIQEISKQLTRNDGTQYVGLGVSSAHILRLNPFSVPYVDPSSEKSAINSEQWKQVFINAFIKPAEVPGYREKIKSLGNKIPTGSSFTKDRDLAMYIALSNIFINAGTADEMSSMNWDMVSSPTFKEAPGVGSQSYPVYFSITSTAKHKDEAMEVIKYLASDELQMEYSKNGIMTVLKNSAIQKEFGQATKYKDKNVKSVFYNKLAPISPKTVYDAAAETIYRKDLTDLSMGTIDINTAFRQAEEATNKAITEAKNK